MQIFLISPYHAGSHKAWAEGYKKHSKHDVEIFSMLGQSWKWRMHGAAVTLSKQVLAQKSKPDLVLVDDMLDLSTFIALTRKQLAGVPFALYMHENQLLYPVSPDIEKGPMRRNWGVRERQYVLINWKSMLAADRIYFNSQFHLNALFAELPAFLRHYSDHNEEETVEILAAKSMVLPIAIEYPPSQEITEPMKSTQPQHRGLPVILWNQRWEFDKNPAGFFAALRQFKIEGGRFKLIVCGESFQKAPELFEQAEKEFAAECLHFGFASRERYQELLTQSDIVVSTAHHEFFGISILEAIQAGAFPLLPNRLSYPELIPAEHHAEIIYEDQGDLIRKLHAVIELVTFADIDTAAFKKIAYQYSWQALIGQYDQEFESLTRIH
ncbi:MAG: glycosyltransferase involved in cell wall biosynthesis [Cellvibrionaceae bacterium]|jgi:glycosyltransferase involved in cell wall biosynthesis